MPLSPSTKLRMVWRRLQRRLLLKEQVQANLPVIFHGSQYGGWFICPNALSPATIVYSFGIGDDISFDLSLIAAYGLKVFGFDPTPKSIDWVKASDSPKQFHFFDYGVAGYDGTAKFYPPQNPGHMSHSIIPKDSPTGPPLAVPVFRLKTIMDRLGHTKVDVLKLDIEGAEYDVIDDLLKSKIRPAQLLVEFHDRFPNVGVMRTVRAIRSLNQAGYEIFAISNSGEEYSFIRHKIDSA